MDEINFYLKDEGFEEPPEDIYYLLAANGLFVVAKTIFFKVAARVFEPSRDENTLDFLRAHEEKAELTLRKKVPSLLFRQALSLFREKRGNECFGIIYWNELTEMYELVIPEQEVGPCAVYKAEVGPVPEGRKRLGDIHSHDDMLALPSVVDEADEEHDTGLHIIVGEVGGMPSVFCAISAYGQRFPVSQKDVFESEELENPELPPVPPEWLDKIRVRGERKKKKRGDG